MLLEYLVPSRARREVWKALRSEGAGLTVRALARQAGVPYSNAHREILRMKELGLLRTEWVGKSLLCAWNKRHPAARKLAELMGATRDFDAVESADDAVYGSLKSWGAGLARDTAAAKPLGLDETLAYGVALARRDPDIAQIWPVVLAKNRAQVDLDRLGTLVRRLGQKRALGFLLTLTGLLLKDPSLAAAARRCRDSRVRRTQAFFSNPNAKRTRALAEGTTPKVARDWHFSMNTSLESFQSHFGKFVRPR